MIIMEEFECKEHGQKFQGAKALEQHNDAKHPKPSTFSDNFKKIRIPKLTFAGVTVIGIAAILLYYFSSTPASAHSISIDGVQCNSLEGSVIHIHPHLTIISNGNNAIVPADIGILSTCLYWIHTHDSSGTIHIESPVVKNYTLGQFIDIWNATQRYASSFDPSSLSSAASLTAYVNGNVYNGNYRNISLIDGEQIKLVINS